MDLSKLLSRYEEVFEGELSTLQGYQATLELRPAAKPVFCRARSVPYALRGAIEQTLDRMEQEGILEQEQITQSEWATPILPVLKGYGSVGLFSDF